VAQSNFSFDEEKPNYESANKSRKKVDPLAIQTIATRKMTIKKQNAKIGIMHGKGTLFFKSV
jgi:hypothetical protein